MYIELVGDIRAGLNIKYLPDVGDIVCVRGEFYRVSLRFYNTDIEEWAINVNNIRVTQEIKDIWKTEDEESSVTSNRYSRLSYE